MPTYRRPHYLIESLGSVLASTYTDFEVIVHNDGEEADLSPVRERLPDPRIRWITNSERLGVVANHLDAFPKARGEFIAFLDDDDLWTPELLATLVAPLEEHPDVVVAFADHYVIDANGDIDWPLTEDNSSRYTRATLAPGRHESYVKQAAIDQFIPVQCAAVFRKDALSPSDFNYGVSWDLWTAYLLARSGGDAWYVPQRLALYRAHSASITRAGLKDTAGRRIGAMTRFLEDETLRPWTPVLRRRLAEGHHRLATEQLRDGDIADARHNAFRSVLARPTARSIVFAAAVLLAPRTSRRILHRRRPMPLLEREP
jgi:glycosyltransferase involved in cell wall biosynthesis